MNDGKSGCGIETRNTPIEEAMERLGRSLVTLDEESNSMRGCLDKVLLPLEPSLCGEDVAQVEPARSALVSRIHNQADIVDRIVRFMEQTRDSVEL